MPPLRILLADDHEVVRYGLSKLIDSCDDLQVIAEASTGDQALKLYQQYRPDVGIIDITMPVYNGVETAKKIKEFDQKAVILILTMHDEVHYLEDVLKAGVNGYILKNSGPDELLQAIRNVARGQSVFSEQISELLTQRFIKKTSNEGTESGEKLPTLTQREKEILNLIADGNTTPQIASMLSISPRTVESHRNNLKGKIGCKNTAELVRFALNHSTDY